MLRQMPKQLDALDRVFHALADPTRRAVLRRLSRGDAAVSDLARPFAMALSSFVQHLEVLETSGLMTSRKAGRVRTYRLAPRGPDPAEHRLATQREMWEQRLDQLDAYLTGFETELKERP